MKIKKEEEHYLQELLSHLKMNRAEFAKTINTSQERINRVMLFKNGVSSQLANTIIEKYPSVNYYWLRNGKGNMLNSENENTEQGNDLFSVPLIPFTAIAGFGSFGLTEGVKKEDCEEYVVPEFIKGGVEFVIRVNGSSMYPKYSNGDILACRKVYEILYFQWGKTYVIDSFSQGVMVKRIYKSNDDDYITLVSDNKERYDAFDIPKSDIRSLSIVLGVIRME